MSARHTLAALLVALGAIGCGRAMVAPLRYGPLPLAPDQPFRASAPAATPVAADLALPWRVTTLPSGVRVVLLERHALPVATVRLVIDRGAADIEVREDLADLLDDVLDAGTAARTGPELGEAWAQLGAVHGASLGADGGAVWGKVVAADLDAAVALIAETATQPRLTARSLDHVRAQALLAVANGRYNTQQALRRNVAALLFGRDHMYGYAHRSAAETNALRFEDVATFQARLFQPAHATLIVVGDVTPEQVDASAARWLGAWSSRSDAPIPRTKKRPPVMFGARVVHVERGDKTETTVAILARGPGVASADVAALEILARSFGGLSSRLRGDVSAEQGAAYVFGAGVSRFRMASYLSVGGALAADRAMPAVRAMLAAIAETVRSGIPDAELTRARTSLLSEWRARVAVTDGVAALAGGALVGGLTLDDVARYPARLEAVTREDVRRVAAEYLDAGALRLVVVGSAGLRAELGQLGLGPVQRRDEWGDVVP